MHTTYGKQAELDLLCSSFLTPLSLYNTEVYGIKGAKPLISELNLVGSCLMEYASGSLMLPSVIHYRERIWNNGGPLAMS